MKRSYLFTVAFALFALAFFQIAVADPEREKELEAKVQELEMKLDDANQTIAELRQQLEKNAEHEPAPQLVESEPIDSETSTQQPTGTALRISRQNDTRTPASIPLRVLTPFGSPRNSRPGNLA